MPPKKYRDAATGPAPENEAEPPARLLGRGRSAEVFLDRDADGLPIVRKVFRGERLSKWVLYLLTGAANPYTWCEAAIRAALARRKVLAVLVAYWFGDRDPRRLRLPRTFGWRWDPERRAHELLCELVDGRHVPLRGPGAAGAGRDDPLPDLTRGIMRPLQRHLDEAGFDGLLWQAGRGNPVAASNFMLEELRPGAPEGHGWVWIDLESGVPALFALDPRATLGFYLPKSLHHRRWLFDDVDVGKLRAYLDEHRRRIEEALAPPAFEEFLGDIDELEARQEEWRAIPRHRRGIAYELSQGRLTPEEAERYAGHPWRWSARLLATGARRGLARAAAAARRAWTRLWRLDLRRALRDAWRFASSQRFRSHVARRFVAGRLRDWSRRRFLDPGAVRRLRGQLRHDDASSYLTDFAVHLMIKPLVKTVQWFAVPSMLAIGWLGVTSAALLLVAGGSIGRTLYTSGRLVQAIGAGQRRPWIALAVGLLPVVGNAAYPAQLLYRGTERTSDLALFILCDTFAAIGRAVPVWGGADSLTEHLANRWGYTAVRWLARPL